MVSKGLSICHSCSLAVLGLAPMAVGALALAGLMAGTASASTITTTIYAENFGGAATTALVGTAPTTDNGASPTWANQFESSTRGDNWLANGTITGSLDSGGFGALEVASLDFTPVVGHIYTLTAVLTPTGYESGNNASDGEMMAGFINGNGTGAPFFNTVGPFLSASFTGTTSSPSYVPGGSFGPGFANAWSASGTPATGGTLKLVLNTTNPSIWSANGYYNGVEYGGWGYNSGNGTTNPTGITQVAIGVNGTSGSITDFSLTDTYTVVPEPASLGLLAVGGLGLLLLKRRRAVPPGGV